MKMTRNEAIRRFFDLTIADMKAMQNNSWINAKERLPEKEGVYLCWTVFNGVEAHYQINLWKDGRWFWVHDVRYWMPFPNPPKGVK